MSPSSISVLLVDDHPVVLEGLRLLLERQPDIEVAGEATSTGSALATGAGPDVIVTDLMLGEDDPEGVVPALRRRFPEAAILVLSMVDEPAQVRRVLAAGARGYLLKAAAADELVDAVRRVARGEGYLQPALGAELARATAAAELREGAASVLTDREREVLRLIARGHTNTEIAAALNIAPRTVETHRSHILDRFGVRTRAELVRIAIELGIADFTHP